MKGSHQGKGRRLEGAKDARRRTTRWPSPKEAARHRKNLDLEEDGSARVISRVHPKGKGGGEGLATRVRVYPSELAEDLQRGMPRRFLVPKYRLPQKGATVTNPPAHTAHPSVPLLDLVTPRQ